MASGTEAVTVEQVARALGVETASALPSGYTRLEYIEGTGTQYIDTAYFPCELTRVVTAIMPTSGNTTNGVFGGRTDNNAATFSLWCLNGVFRTDFDTNSQHVTTDVKVETGVRIEVDKDRGTTKLGSKTFTQTGVGFRAANSMHVFAVNPDGSGPRYFRGRIETFSIYESGLLKHELVPARRASDGSVGMYDTVGGTFLANSGTGAFKAGPEVAAAPVDGAEGAVVTLKQFNVAAGKLSGGGSGDGEDWPDPLTATPAQLKEASERLTEANMQSAINFYAPFVGKSRQLGGWPATLAGVCHDTRPDGRKALTTWVLDEMYTLGSVAWGYANSAVDGWPESRLRGELNEYMEQELTSDVVDAACEVVKDSFYFDIGGDTSPRLVASTDRFFIPSLAELGIDKATIMSASLDIKDGEKYAFVDGRSAFAAVGGGWTRSSYSVFGAGMEAFEVVDSNDGCSPLSVSSRSSVVPFLCI